MYYEKVKILRVKFSYFQKKPQKKTYHIYSPPLYFVPLARADVRERTPSAKTFREADRPDRLQAPRADVNSPPELPY
jgi:hypothetical protein